MGQLGFFGADKRLAAISAKGDPLEMIDRVVPFESFRAEIEAVVLTPALVRIEKSDLPHRATSANLVVISQTRTNWLRRLFFEVPYRFRARPTRLAQHVLAPTAAASERGQTAVPTPASPRWRPIGRARAPARVLRP